MDSPRTAILGIDPGATATGYALIATTPPPGPPRLELVAAAVVERDKADRIAGHGYGLARWVAQVLEAGDTLLDEVTGHALPFPATEVLVAIENVRAPNPHHQRRDGRSVTNPDGIIATAAVLGALVRRWPGAVIVEPGGNGSHVADAYPAAIAQPPGGRGRDRLRHARSAYDVALAARARALHRAAQAEAAGYTARTVTVRP